MKTQLNLGSNHAGLHPLFDLDKKLSHEMALDQTGGFHLLEKAADLAAPEL